MRQNIDDSVEIFCGHIVTLRSITGEEIIGKFSEYNAKNGNIRMEHPLVVLLDETGSTMTVPFSLSGDNHSVVINQRNVFAVVLASEISASDYQAQVPEIS